MGGRGGGGGGAGGGEIAQEAKVVAAVRSLAPAEEFVSLVDLRAELASKGMSRSQQDDVLRRMARGDYGGGKVIITQETNQKALSRAGRAAALNIAGQDNHVIKILGGFSVRRDRR